MHAPQQVARAEDTMGQDEDKAQSTSVDPNPGVAIICTQRLGWYQCACYCDRKHASGRQWQAYHGRPIQPWLHSSSARGVKCTTETEGGGSEDESQLILVYTN